MARATAPKTLAITPQAIPTKDKSRPNKSTKVPPRDFREDL